MYESHAVPHVDGLTVEHAMTRVGGPEVCPACHRSTVTPGACKCKSHVPHVPERLKDGDEFLSLRQRQTGMTGRQRVEATLTEVRRCYYDTRDPAEILRIVRELAERVYLA